MHEAAHFEIDRRLLARVRGRIDKKSFFVNGELDPVIRQCSRMLRLAAQSVKTTDQARALEVVQTGFVRAFSLADQPNT